MNDSLEDFESELKQLKPLAPSRNLAAKIGQQLDQPARMTFADRLLMTFMGAGALAAVVIVSLISLQLLKNQPQKISPPLATLPSPAPASVGEYQLALARFDGRTLEIFR